MNKTRRFSGIFALGLCLALVFSGFAWAGSSSLTKYDGGKFDLVVSMATTPTDAQKATLGQVFDLFAKDIYRSTEGVNTLRRLYVYTPNPTTGKPREWNKADIQFALTADDAWANPSGFKRAGSRIFVDDNLNDINEIGHALAHECGHYLYGLYDEYRANQGRENIPSSPHSTDTPKQALMAQHRTYWHFTTRQDYADATKRATAQYRTYFSSCWQTLVRPVAFDPIWVTAEALLGKRNMRWSYPELRAFAEPKTYTALAQPVNNPALDVVWMEGSEVVVVIDYSGSMSGDRMASAKSGAKSYIDLCSSSDYGAVVKFTDSVSTIGALAQLSAGTKTAFKNAIDSYNAGGGTAIGSALRAALNILNTSARQGTFKYIVLLTDGQNGSGENPTGQILTDLRAAGYPVYSIGLGSGADMATLAAISSGTNGKSFAAATGANLNSIYSQIQTMTSDEKLVAWVKENLNLNKASTSTVVPVDTTCTKAVFNASFPTAAAMTATITMPDGTLITSANYTSYTGVEYSAGSGYAIFTVTNPTAGNWLMTLTATNPTANGVEVILEGKATSDFSIAAEVTGGTYPTPIVVQATVFRDFNITGLNVEALVTAPDGSQSVLALLDDGRTPDMTAGDGVYTGVITNYQNGDYEFTITATNPTGNAVETPAAMLKDGSRFISKNIATLFQAVATGELTASGVTADDHAGDFINATPLPLDGTLIDGFIEIDEDVDYFYFDATAGTKLTFFTCNLFPAVMKTLVTLYASDMTTVLATDEYGNQGKAARIVWTVPADGRYYLSVQHGSPGTGTYSVGARDYQASDDLVGPPAGNAAAVTADGETAYSSSGLCFVKSVAGNRAQDATGLVLMALACLAAAMGAYRFCGRK